MNSPISRRTMLRAGAGAIGAALLYPARGEGAPAYTQESVKQPAVISGVVRYQGKVGRPPRVTFGGDCAYCRKFDLREESLLVARGGALRNVVVALEGIRRGKPASGNPVMAERKCTFVPHVLSVTSGSKVLLHNQDPVLNTFHAVNAAGRTLFNIGMPRRDQKVYRRIRETGVIQMRCDVHPWEIAYILSVGHPYHAVTDARGAFTLAGIPPGRYTLVLWHEKLGVRRQKVELGPGAHLQLKPSYPPKR